MQDPYSPQIQPLASSRSWGSMYFRLGVTKQVWAYQKRAARKTWYQQYCQESWGITTLRPRVHGLCRTILGTRQVTEDLFNNDVHLSKADINQVREYIEKTTQPSWHVAPPSNLGERRHGKLKADQWQSCIEFDVPVSLVQMLSDNKREGKQITHGQILQSTLFLATAICWAMSHRTSKVHKVNYMKNMHAYLQSLLDMFPEMTLLPNHHAALHIGPQLLYFGPMHGWWTFPFERIIRILQQYNTNSN